MNGRQTYPRNLARQDQALAYLRAQTSPASTNDVIEASFRYPCTCKLILPTVMHPAGHFDYPAGRAAILRLERAGLVRKIRPEDLNDRNVYWLAEPWEPVDLSDLEVFDTSDPEATQ